MQVVLELKYYVLSITQEVDEGAPEIWHRMIKEGSSSEFFEELDDESKSAIQHWNTKRAALLRDRMQQEMAAKLEEYDFVSDPSVPFVKVLMKSDTALDDPRCEEAMLTVWNPSSEQLDTLRDGALLRLKNLDTKGTRFDGQIQLTGNSSTSIALVRDDDRQMPAARNYTSIFRLQLASKRLNGGEESQEQRIPQVVILMGVVFKVSRRTDGRPGWFVYLTDESNIRLRLETDTTRNDFGSFLASMQSHSHTENEERYRLVALRGLLLAPFDCSDNCAVVRYIGNSRLEENPLCHRAERLNRWMESDAGRKRLQKLALYTDLGIDETIRFSPEMLFDVVGYIAGFRVLRGKPQLLIQVDCGGPIHTWKLPLSKMSAFAATCSALDEEVVLNSDEEIKMKPLMSIGRVFRARQSPYCFSLKRTTEADGSNCAFEVACIANVDTKTLAALYSTLLE